MAFEKSKKRNERLFCFLIILILILTAATAISIRGKSIREYQSHHQKQQKVVLQNKTLKITSVDFADGGEIPMKFTCDAGKNMPNPKFTIRNVPEGTESFVMVMDDSDIPQTVKMMIGKPKYNHWVLYNIPGSLREISSTDTPGIVGKNDDGGSGYTGPCPPDNMEPYEHRYIFRLYALPEILSFEKEPTLDEVEIVAKEKAIDVATYTGTYNRKK